MQPSARIGTHITPSAANLYLDSENKCISVIKY